MSTIHVKGIAKFRNVHGKRIQRTATFESDFIICSLQGDVINLADELEYAEHTHEHPAEYRVEVALSAVELKSFAWSGKLGIEMVATCEMIKKLQ